ncbi:MAG: hypothetical protein IRY85_10395 [Micromonosporaceae bacterium]|nr:hypothetical protein [Micromonosporaceae bacterium]
MWRNRWVRVGAIALGFFLINGLARFISNITAPDESEIPPLRSEDSSTDVVIAVSGALAIVLLLAVAAGFWAVRHPAGRMAADLGLATLVGTLLALLVGPFFGGNKPFDEGLEMFVLQFLQFLGLGALGIFLGFVTMVVLGKDWKTRGLAAYAERYGRRPRRVS